MRKERAQYAGTWERRREIIDAALACFVEDGFVNVTMKDIRVRSGASNGSIYHHFKSKEQLAAAVYLEGITDYQQGLLSELVKNPGARDGIYAMVRYDLHWVKRNPAWTYYLFQMRHADFMQTAEKSILEKNKIFVSGIAKWFSDAVKSGKLRTLPPELYISLILGPCQEFARHWILRDRKADIESAIEEISKAAWNALKAAK